MRYLGIDYGDKRVGLALSDEQGLLGMPFDTFENDENFIKKLKDTIYQEDVESIILGLPLSFKMEETEQTKKVLAFKERLSKLVSIPIELQNELLTSVQAEKSGAEGPDIDSSSAALILQSYLDKVNR